MNNLGENKNSFEPELDEYGRRVQPPLGDIIGWMSYRQEHLSPKEIEIEESNKVRREKYTKLKFDEEESTNRKLIKLVYDDSSKTAFVILGEKHIEIIGSLEVTIIKLLVNNDELFDSFHVLNEIGSHDDNLDSKTSGQYRHAAWRVSEAIEKTFNISGFIKYSRKNSCQTRRH